MDRLAGYDDDVIVYMTYEDANYAFYKCDTASGAADRIYTTSECYYFDYYKGHLYYTTFDYNSKMYHEYEVDTVTGTATDITGKYVATLNGYYILTDYTGRFSSAYWMTRTIGCTATGRIAERSRVRSRRRPIDSGFPAMRIGTSSSIRTPRPV